MNKLKCWFWTAGQFRTGGTRIENNLKKFAPDNIEFTNNPDEADFYICHMQMKYDLDRFLDCKKPLVFLISEIDKFPNAKEYYDYFFENCCAMTYTFHPLELQGYKGKNHVWGAWGVDTEIFNANPYEVVHKERKNNIITFGYYDSEHYSEIFDSTKIVANKGKMIHLDVKKWDFLRQGKFFDEKYHWHKEWVSDEELANLYQSCKFVSGLRSGAGYEVTVLEGILNGCRPICFDSIYYRKWYNDFALFIPEGEYDIDMTNNLVSIFRDSDMHKVSVDEIKHVRNTYGWDTITANFWKEVLQRI